MRTPRLLSVGLLLIALGQVAPSAEVAPPPQQPGEPAIEVRLPPSMDAKQLADVLAEHVGITIQYDPARLNGSVRLVLPATTTRSQIWDAANQAFLAAGLAVVAAGDPPQYRLVPLADAAAQAEVMLPERLAALQRQPGYATVILTLAHLSPDVAVKALATVFSNQVSQIRTLGQDGQRVVISAPTALIRQTQAILTVLDRTGVDPAVRLYRPLRTAPQSLQTSANAAWQASGRVTGRTTLAEFQIAPDGQQLLIVTAAEVADQVVALAERLDQTEPTEVRTYRPAHFGLDEVANLLQQVLKDPRGATGGQAEVVRDKLTNRLVVTATAAQHARIAELLADLDQTPSGARRQLRTLAIRNRPVDELSRLLGLVLSSGGSSGSANAAQPRPAATTPAPAPATAGGGTAPLPPLGAGPAQPAAAAGASTGPSSLSVGDSDVSIATDPTTNHLILLGEPQQMDQVAKVVAQLDVRQPQVQLEVVLVTVSGSQNQTLGVELLKQIEHNQTSGVISSLFGLSTGTAANATARALPAAATGLGALVIRPGDYAGVITALETINNGHNVIRSNVVVANNATASINGVVQQPLTSINSSTTVATTAVSGTTDAGTQISITPQISAADQVSLTYTISESAFLGTSTTTPSGTVIPAPKRSDSISSVATIPDGYTIALGGLANRSTTHGESRVPGLGAIPVLGWLFSSRSDADENSRFYVFIRADVLRSATFADLRRLSDRVGGAAEVDSGWPKVEPQFTP